jgi:Fe-Mn family superoxide dismutase
MKQQGTTLDRGVSFELAPLPYPENALEPFISARTISFHYGKHHQKYVDTLNQLVAGTEWESAPLEDVVVESAGLEDKKAVFNNAGQAWNHSFFWHCMRPGGGGMPQGRIKDEIEEAFGSFSEFKTAFTSAGVALFGSGYVWLVQDSGELRVVTTSNADNPLAHGQTGLLTCDLWEHAYYLDYQNRRQDFIQGFLDHLANWNFAESQMT